VNEVEHRPFGDYCLDIEDPEWVDGVLVGGRLVAISLKSEGRQTREGEATE